MRSLIVFVDSETAEAINRARIELERRERIAEVQGPGSTPRCGRDEAATELERLQDEAVANEQVVSFSFRAIGRKPFEKLKEEHPATDEQQRQAREEVWPSV